ncbi:hypothetical protein OPKNFCMD_5200 [Methylobacterium crusticola]|uniref:Uncharacterized protein n=1 Tax=Methylobacterium crusticola TaxID=1697972 RepID=A0ABQ4R687_9HYPH|nr:hypothetical protein [Methylobacterium crusticola]GJD52435.1 hypothetical protein OPKNFCMD_5200 [Methylobacterium crusticola]
MILDDAKTRDAGGPHPIWLVVAPWTAFALSLGTFLARWLP